MPTLIANIVAVATNRNNTDKNMGTPFNEMSMQKV